MNISVTALFSGQLPISVTTIQCISHTLLAGEGRLPNNYQRTLNTHLSIILHKYRQQFAKQMQPLYFVVLVNNTQTVAFFA